MKEDEEEKTEEGGYDLTMVLEVQFKLLQKLQKLDFKEVYDRGAEDRIKCITGIFNSINETQKALIKQIQKQAK